MELRCLWSVNKMTPKAGITASRTKAIERARRLETNGIIFVHSIDLSSIQTLRHGIQRNSGKILN